MNIKLFRKRQSTRAAIIVSLLMILVFTSAFSTFVVQTDLEPGTAGEPRGNDIGWADQISALLRDKGIVENAYYVAENGNDSAAGTMQAPWKTLATAARRAHPGDTVYVRSGIYHETVEFVTDGTREAPIFIRAFPGETPVIDGRDYALPRGEWSSLVRLTGDYVIFSGFEVRYSNYIGVLVTGDYSVVADLDVHHNMENGIFLSGDYTVADGNTVWLNCLSNENGISTRRGWASGLSAGRRPNFAIIRRNTVYANYGEGLSTYEANGTLIEGNEVYDNWATNIYISDATDVVFVNNYVYNTTSGLMPTGNKVGIMLGDEQYDPPSADITIRNNIVVNTNINLYWWQGVQGGGMKDVIITHNTFIDSLESANIRIAAGPHENVLISSNVFLQNNRIPISMIARSDGLQMSQNIWSKIPDTYAAGTGDIIASYDTWAAYALWMGRGSVYWLVLATTLTGFNWENLVPGSVQHLMPCGKYFFDKTGSYFCG